MNIQQTITSALQSKKVKRVRRKKAATDSMAVDVAEMRNFS